MFKLARYMNVEFKQHILSSSYTGAEAGDITQLTNIDQGDTDETRDGSSIKITSMLGRIALTKDSNVTTTIVRLIIVLDKQTNQAVYSATDLLQTGQVLSSLNIDNGRRFKVLLDRLVTLTDDFPLKVIKFYKRLNLHIRYDNTGNGIADLTQNSLSMFTLDNQTTTNFVNVTYNIKLRYVDN